MLHVSPSDPIWERPAVVRSPSRVSRPDLDVAIVGAGAAGLATAIFARRLDPGLRVAAFDGAARPGAKILVSGGSRCNVTNTIVTAADFSGGKTTAVARVLGALPVPETVEFFAGIGVPLKEEPGGKLFPVTNRSRDVLEALLRELTRAGGELRAGDRVRSVTVAPDGFHLTTDRAEVTSAIVVLATGGLSLPKTGSDGWGYTLAQRLGHSIVPTTPALVPLRLTGPSGDGTEPSTPLIHTTLSGVAQPVRLDVRIRGKVAHRITGSLLWTHFGISGPAALDASRHWLRAGLEGQPATLSASLCPDHDFASLEAAWLALGVARPRLGVETALAQMVPASVAAAIVSAMSIDRNLTLASLARDARRLLIGALLEWPLPVTGSRGYSFAEVTAGGVSLAEVSTRTMESRICPGLFLVGEILDVDGRLGGFNFQWGWSSARVAAAALAGRRAASDGAGV